MPKAIKPNDDATAPAKILPTIVAEAEVVSVTPENQWNRAREIVSALKCAARGMLALQLLAGAELIELRKQHGIKPGRRTDLHQSDALNWQELVKQNLGISHETARRWMEMAIEFAPRLKKLGGDFRSLPFLELPPHRFTPEQQELLSKGVAKLTDGRTQLEFLIELGLAKKPQGSGTKGGARSKSGAPCDPNAPVEVARDLVLNPARQLFGHWKEHWMHLPQNELQELHDEFAAVVRQIKKALQGDQ